MMLRLILIAGLLVSLGFTAIAAEQKPIRFGLTAVVVRENLRFFDNMTNYLSRRLERPVEFVRRKSYREIMNLLATVF